MSWTDNLLFKGSNNRSQGQCNSQKPFKDIEQDVVLSGALRKLKTGRKLSGVPKKRWFVLYKETKGKNGDSVPARLEYFDNEKGWKDGHNPRRSIILKDCFNICKKQDTRDSKNNFVIAIYTLEDCLSIVFEEEQELKNWLIELLSHQKGNISDGKIPKPTYENMWQLHIKEFKPENDNNKFNMVGSHRLCVTIEELMFFPVGSSNHISFPLFALRSCISDDKNFYVNTGRPCLISGPGTLIMQSDDKDISANINKVVSEAMKENKNNRDKLKLPSLIQKTSRKEDQIRSRTYSWSAMDENKPHKYVPKPNITHLNPSISSSQGPRNRTISEGNQMDSIKRIKKPTISGSPLSPGPGSCISSESAGSSNSIDENDGCERRYYPYNNDSQPMTIPEESSAGSSVDPNANRELSESPINEPSSGVSHARTKSDLVNYTSVEVGGYPCSPPTFGNSTRTPSTEAPSYSSTTYSTLMCKNSPSLISSGGDYIAMTPNSSISNGNSYGFKRNHSLDHHSPSVVPEQNRLEMQSISNEINGGGGSSTATITSPSSQSSYNPLDDVDDQHLPSNLHNPKSISKKSASGTSPAVEDDEYMSMSPAGASSLSSPITGGVRNKQNMAISLHDGNKDTKNQDYVVMSPVNIDLDRLEQEKLRRISEEDSGNQNQTHSNFYHSDIRSHGGARPKYSQRSSASGSKRSSFCSDVGGDFDEHFIQLQQNHPAFEHEKISQPENNSSDYVALDYSRTKLASSSIPIPKSRSNAGRASPTSSSSFISGTPNSFGGGDSARYPSELHFESKAKSYLRDDNEDDKLACSPPSGLPTRAYSVSIGNRPIINSNSSSTNRSRTGSITSGSKFIDIPKGGSKSKLSPVSSLRTPNNSLHGHSPNLISRIDNWFRNRAGSVPAKPPFINRRRHRTQSESEKDSPENQELK